MVKKVINRFRIIIWKYNRNKINQKNIKRLRSKDITIISMNCTGGILYHDLNLRFLSPTINMYFRAEDFLKFCENLRYYTSLDLEECTDEVIKEDRDYPIAYLGDLVLFLVHYDSFENARVKWNERIKRINWNNIVILNTDREGCTNSIKDRFEKLPYRKVLFTNLPDIFHESCFYISGFEKDKCVGIVTEPYGWCGKRYIDQFDYVGLFNEE